METVRDVLAAHRCRARSGDGDLICSCGEVLWTASAGFPNGPLSTFGLSVEDAAALDHIATAIERLIAEERLEALRDAATLMRRCKDPAHWNLRDPNDPEASYSPDRWLEVVADRREVVSVPLPDYMVAPVFPSIRSREEQRQIDQTCPKCGGDRRLPNLSPGSACHVGEAVRRLDKYTLLVDGHQVLADDITERRIRAMTEAERSRFLTIMGKSRGQ